MGAVIRVIPFTLPNPADYHIPDDVMACADFQKGLVLVTGPAGAGKSTTLACIIDKLNKAFVAALNAPETKTRFAALLAEPVATTPQQFDSFMAAERAKYQQVVKASGARVD